MITKTELKELKEKTKNGFYIFHDYHEFIVRFNRKEKSLFVQYIDTKFRCGCRTEKEAIETALMLLNNWIDE